MTATLQTWFDHNGFNTEGFTYCIFGDNTYAIKDELKKLGCKYSPILKWHSSQPLELPTGYGMFPIAFDDILYYDKENDTIFYYETAELFISKKIADAEGPSLSEYMGQPGERLRHVTALLKSVRGFSGMYGWTNIYTFTIGDNLLVWMTSVTLNIKPNTIVDLSATITKHETYHGKKTTKINRCKVIPVNES